MVAPKYKNIEVIQMASKLLNRPTLKEIAAHSGVSMATVDRVLSSRAKVSPHTRERVMKSIEALTGGVVVAGSKSAAKTGRIKPLVFALVMEGGSAFLRTVERKVDSVRQRYLGLGVQIVTYSPENYSVESYKQLLQTAAKKHDGLIVVSRENTEVSATINAIVSGGTPVVCLTTDLSDTLRLGYSGMNNTGAGRVAARLMGKFTGGKVGDVILIVSAPYHCQYERELGFRRILRENFPKLRIRESIDNHDLDSDSYGSLMKLFKAGVKPLGIYNVTGGTAGVVRALDEMGWTNDCFYIAHELDDVSHPLLAEGKINVVMDQDFRSEIILAVNGLMYHCGALARPPVFTEASPIVTTRENMGGLLEIDIPSSEELISS